MNEKGEKIKVFLEVEPNTEVTIKPIAAELAKKSIPEGNVTAGIKGTGSATVTDNGHVDADVDVQI